MKTLAIMAIPLSRGLFALVDGEDYRELSKYKWYAWTSGYTFYAVRTFGKGLNRGQRIYMHRQILNAQAGEEVDHRNHYGLDNRRQEIRICTRSENGQNQRLQQVDKTSRFKGVFWSKQLKKWCAQICLNGKSMHIAYCVDETEAACAYNTKARELFGEFSHTNF